MKVKLALSLAIIFALALVLHSSGPPAKKETITEDGNMCTFYFVKSFSDLAGLEEYLGQNKRYLQQYFTLASPPEGAALTRIYVTYCGAKVCLEYTWEDATIFVDTNMLYHGMSFRGTPEEREDGTLYYDDGQTPGAHGHPAAYSFELVSGKAYASVVFPNLMCGEACDAMAETACNALESLLPHTYLVCNQVPRPTHTPT